MTTTPTAPDRTTDQRLDALKKANAIRRTRADWRRSVLEAYRAGIRNPHLVRFPWSYQAAMLVLRSPPWAARWATGNFLRALPTIGEVKSYQMMTAIGIHPRTTLGGLRDRQRDELFDALEQLDYRGRT